MFVCCSSGAFARYRRDILRAIALPTGARLQFRYDFKYVDPGVKAKVEAEKWKLLKAEELTCILCYCDQSDPDRLIELVPCRYATIVDVEEMGTSFVITFELTEFAFADDSRTFQTQVTSASSRKLPHWRGADEPQTSTQGDKLPSGFHWFEINQPLDVARKTIDLVDWQGIVLQLYSHDDYKHEAAFYTVLGVRATGANSWAKAKNGIFQLEPGREHELMIYQYHPSPPAVRPTLQVTTSSSLFLSFITGQRLILDSPHDSYRVRFQVHGSVHDEVAVLSLLRRESGPRPAEAASITEPVWDFDLSLRIKHVFWPSVAKGCIAGVLLWAAFMLEVLHESGRAAEQSKGQIPLWCVILGSLLFYIVAGLAAAFHFEKPFGD